MKNFKLLSSALIVLLGIIIFSSCDKEEDKATGFVTFGANSYVINCITVATVYVDNVEIGTIPYSTDTIVDCGEEPNITNEVTVGSHSYKVEIRPDRGDGCSTDVNGTFTISEDECEKIFIDYYEAWRK